MTLLDYIIEPFIDLIIIIILIIIILIIIIILFSTASIVKRYFNMMHSFLTYHKLEEFDRFIFLYKAYFFFILILGISLSVGQFSFLSGFIDPLLGSGYALVVPFYWYTFFICGGFLAFLARAIGTTKSDRDNDIRTDSGNWRDLSPKIINYVVGITILIIFISTIFIGLYTLINPNWIESVLRQNIAFSYSIYDIIIGGLFIIVFPAFLASIGEWLINLLSRKCNFQRDYV